MKDYSTPAEGILKREADGTIASQEVTEVELVDLAAVATSGDYNDLSNKPTIPDVSSLQPTITADGFLKGDGSGNITADKPVFTVNMTPTEADSSIGTADKTPEEILAAYNAGYTVQALCQVPGANSPVTLTLIGIAEGADVIGIVFSASVSVYEGELLWRGWTVSHLNVGNNWQIYKTDMVPTTRTINNKPLSYNITLTAADVNAVGLKGNQEIAGTKTFTEKVKFHPSSVSFDNGEVNFNGANIFLDGNRVQFLPTVSTSDNGKFLRVVDGAWAAATVDNANGVSF